VTNAFGRNLALVGLLVSSLACGDSEGPGEEDENPAPDTEETTAWARGLAWYQENTGVPEGVTLRESDALTITEDDTVIDGLDVHGGIVIRARNVTVRNSRTTGRIYIESGTALIEHVEVDQSANPIHWSQQHGIAVADGTTSTIRFSRMHGMQQGIAFQGATTIEDNWIYGIRVDAEGHADGILSNGPTDGSIIRRNWIDATPDEGHTVSGPLCMYGDFGQIRNVLVEGNLLTGVGFNDFGAATQKPHPAPYNVEVINNHFQPPFTWDQPLYPSRLDPLSESKWSNNRITTTDALVDPPRGDGQAKPGRAPHPQGPLTGRAACLALLLRPRPAPSQTARVGRQRGVTWPTRAASGLIRG